MFQLEFSRMFHYDSLCFIMFHYVSVENKDELVENGDEREKRMEMKTMYGDEPVPNRDKRGKRT